MRLKEAFQVILMAGWCWQLLFKFFSGNCFKPPLPLALLLQYNLLKRDPDFPGRPVVKTALVVQGGVGSIHGGEWRSWGERGSEFADLVVDHNNSPLVFKAWGTLVISFCTQLLPREWWAEPSQEVLLREKAHLVEKNQVFMFSLGIYF